MTALQAEQEDNRRIQQAREAIAYAQEKEAEARKVLGQAEQTTKRMREKFEALFAECEKRAVERRKSGQIENSSCY